MLSACTTGYAAACQQNLIMAVKDDRPGNSSDDMGLDWSVENEVQLFQAMTGHKPVGVNRFFQMACIHEKLSNSLNKEISSQIIWEKLDTMYDMAALHESEIIPFPNEETDFSLPSTDFGPLLLQKQGHDALEPNVTAPKLSFTPKSESKSTKTESTNQETKSKSGKESYNLKGKMGDLLNTPKSVKSENLNVKTKLDLNVTNPNKSGTRIEATPARAPQSAKSAHKEPINSSKSVKQEISSKTSKDTSSSIRSAKSELRKTDSNTPKTHKSDIQQNSKTQVKDKGTTLRGEKTDSNIKPNKELSRSSRESSKSRNNNDSSSDDMPLSSVTKSKKQEETTKRKRPSRNTDAKGNSPNISTSKRRRN